jgi:hypothetical protein
MSTVNENLEEARIRGIPIAKIDSGYYIGAANLYILCKCDGSGEMGEFTCKCGAQVYCCAPCFSTGQIWRCPKCLGDDKQILRQIAKALDIPWEQAKAKWIELQQLQAKPVDFDQLIADGKLEPITEPPGWLGSWLPEPLPNMTLIRFRLLVGEDELPEHVRKRILRRYRHDIGGEVEAFIEFDV